MAKKGFNWKARQVSHTIIDNSGLENIKLDLKGKSSGYDESNALVLPSKKRATKVKKEKLQTTRILSKQQRRRLEKVVGRKKKKEQRAGLLDALKEVRAAPEELQALTSIASVQTKGLKRYFWEQEFGQKVLRVPSNETNVSITANSIRGAKRRKFSEENATETTSVSNPNVVGFEESSSGSGSSDSESESELKSEELNEDFNSAVETETKILPDKSSIDEDEVVETTKATENEIKQEIAAVASNELRKEAVKEEQQLVKMEHKPATFVPVERLPEIQQARLKLPVLAEEQKVMETISGNDVTIIAGETGSGKTTQVPQFLYEAGYTLNGQMIAVTEPRRVAAVSMSERVGKELNAPHLVGYVIRHEGNATDETRIKFMTDGVLLREMQNDFLLSKYSAIVVDEAHERSVHTDILLGLLSRAVPMRRKRNRPLKLIIMSATLRLQDFTDNRRLFGAVPPPVVSVEARQFPVTVHFNRRTQENYLLEAFRKVCKVHAKLPDGAILVFVTGQEEVKSLVAKLRRKFPMRSWNRLRDADVEREQETLHGKRLKKKRTKKKKEKVKVVADVNLDDYGFPGYGEDGDNDVDDQFSDDPEDNLLEENDDIAEDDCNVPLYSLPLYSLLSTAKQQRVFKPPPMNCRLCVVSTNVAETSLTIPEVKYVVDCGRAKVKLYDRITGVSSHVVHWTSKASADQRAGRAGRTGPGHCYRLYSSAVYNDQFALHSEPEIVRKPVDDLYLQMRCMHIDKVLNFPYVTAPCLEQLQCAERRLRILGLLDDELKVSALGKAVARFPVLPRYGKMLALGQQFELLPYVISTVAALSIQEVLLEVGDEDSGATGGKNLKGLRERWAGAGHSLLLGDVSVLLRAVGGAQHAYNAGRLQEFCTANGLRQKAIAEVRKLRLQLTRDIETALGDEYGSAGGALDPHLKPPDQQQCKFLRQIVLAGCGDRVARKVQPDDVAGCSAEEGRKFKYAYRINEGMEDVVLLHRNCVLRRSLPEFVVYQEIFEAGNGKVYLRGVTAVEAEWLVKYVPNLCTLSEPLSDPEPRYCERSGLVLCTVRATFGPQNWQLPDTEIEYRNGQNACKWFARFLLEGKVCPALGKFANCLLSRPATMVKQWTHLQSHTDRLLKSLMAKKVCSRQELLQVWSTHPKYLLEEYLLWLPESAHGDASLLWPPLNKR